MHDFLYKMYALFLGLVASVLGYLIPVKDIIHVMILFFFLDVVVGYWAAKKVRKEKFSVKIIWGHTMPRMVISFVLVIGAYVWDKTYSQEYLSTYKTIGWFISGVLLYSIAENGYKITRWLAFPRLMIFFINRVKDKMVGIGEAQRTKKTTTTNDKPAPK